MHYTIRPLVGWTLPDREKRASTAVFRADWQDTLSLLAGEVEQLGGDHFVIEVDIEESDITIDGRLRRGAHPRTPRVRVSFESRHGPLRYATDAYDQLWSGTMEGWKANARAIALGLRALRAVDRYGIATRAEQYVGYKALPAGVTALGQSGMDRDVALTIIANESEYPYDVLVANPTMLPDAIRKAKRLAHPDNHHGDDAAWNAVDEASRALA